MKRQSTDESDYVHQYEEAKAQGTTVTEIQRRVAETKAHAELAPEAQKAIEKKRAALAQEQTKLDQMEAKAADIGRQLKVKRDSRKNLENRIESGEKVLAEIDAELKTHLGWVADNLVGNSAAEVLPEYTRQAALKLAVDHHRETINRFRTVDIPRIDREIAELSKQ